MKTVADLVKGESPAEPELSFDRCDIEKRLSFPAGRFTSPGPLLPLVGAIALTVAFYAVLSAVPFAHVVAMFTERGVVPYVIVLLTAWSVMIVLVKLPKIALQQKALTINILPTDDPGFVLTATSAQLVLERLHLAVDDPKHFYLTRRIQIALANLKNIGNITDVDKILSTQAENDEAMVESSYTILRGFIWAIPVLGFIGTVLGLSIALGSFGNVLSSAGEMDQMRSALQEVTGGLATAFETTLEGLVAALGVHMLMIMVQRREEQFLDECKDYCQKHIVGRLRLGTGQE